MHHHQHLAFKRKPNMQKQESAGKFLAFIVIFCTFQFVAGVANSSDSGYYNGVKYSPTDFSKLRINIRELYGSRWSLERNKSIDVSHILYITDAGLLHVNELTLRLDFTLIQCWIAPDLEFPVGLFKDSDPYHTPISASVKVLDNMWSPGSYITSSRDSNLKTQDAPLTNVYIYKSRMVLFKTRMNTKVSCTSSFQWYPVDVQSCILVIESFKSEPNIRYYWANQSSERPIKLEMRWLMQYELQLPVVYDHGINGPFPNIQFPFVRVNFTLTRKLGNNIIQVFTPTFLVVVLSWFSFWLGLDAIPGRISLLVTCMLTLVTMHSGMKYSIPPVDYITMMDVWLVSCMAMVFAAIFEFVVIKYAHWRALAKVRSEEKQIEVENQQKLLNVLQLMFNSRRSSKWGYAWDDGVSGLQLRNQGMRSPLGKKPFEYGSEEVPSITEDLVLGVNEIGWRKAPFWITVDKVSRAAFPFVFGCFNVIYWLLLLTKANNVLENDHAYYEN